MEELVKQSENENEKERENESAITLSYINQITEVPTSSGNHEAISEMHRDVLIKGEKYPIILKGCKEVYIGPKIDYNCQQLITNNSSKELMHEKFMECRSRLKNYYRRANSYMRSLFWDGKRRDLPINEYFVELILRKADLFGDMKDENIHLEEIFSKKHGNQIILFTGDAGYGKTTLCNKIAYDWSVEQPGYLQHFDFVVIITLRELQVSVFDTLLEKVCGNSEELKQELLGANANFLVIFDGLDEIREKNLVLKFIRDESVSISLQMTIAITCRPHVSEYVREDCDLLVYIEGFKEKNQQEYIGLMFKSEESKIRDFIQTLDDKKFYSGLAKCPLMMHLLCCVHKNENLQSIDKMTDLYIRMFSLMIKRYVRKVGHCDFLKEGKHFMGENLLVKLGNLALYSDGHFFQVTTKILKECFPIEEEYNFILGIDLLRPYSFFEDVDNISFDFVHSTFQEFLSALFIYEILKTERFNNPCQKNILLFLLGIPGKDPYPDHMLHYLSIIVFNPEIMLQAYREINNKENWNRFCSIAKVLCCSGELDNLRKLFNHFQFSRIYLCIPETKSDYEKLRDEIIEFQTKYASLNKLEIYLFLNRNDTFLSIFKVVSDYRDIREPASLVIDLLCNVDLNKFNIHLCGVTNCGGKLVVTTRGGNFDLFRTIENPILLPEKVKNDMDISTDTKFAALKVIDFEHSRTICQDDLAIFTHSAFVNYLITVEQYEILQKHIKTFPPLQFLAVQRETFDLFYTCKPTYHLSQRRNP